MQNEPLIFSITRGSIDDGDGIRSVVFVKGCPLQCIWCHNPESQSYSHEFFWRREKCLGCGRCVKACPKGRIVWEERRLKWQSDGCDACGRCAAQCPSEALQTLGKHYSVDDLTELLLEDECYYRVSDGGVTFSGGEPLGFPEYVGSVFQRLKKRGISTAVETCGFFTYDKVERLVLPYLDFVMFDLKLMSKEMHCKYIGVDNQLILENFDRLYRAGVRLQPRTPMIPGITDTPENLEATRVFLEQYPNCDGHVRLPYNSLGEKKREWRIIRSKKDQE